jgi:ABC-type multidrug transport system fused ATPase/permease subunit
VPLDEIDLFLLRDRTAVIAQNFTHWPFTARENITIGRHDHPQSEQQLAEATAASGTDAVFARLANGPDTLLDASYQGGTELSGGHRIYVLEHGRVAEHGTHAELMALGGIYQEFYTLQASAYE